MRGAQACREPSGRWRDELLQLDAAWRAQRARDLVEREHECRAVTGALDARLDGRDDDVELPVAWNDGAVYGRADYAGFELQVSTVSVPAAADPVRDERCQRLQRGRTGLTISMRCHQLVH